MHPTAAAAAAATASATERRRRQAAAVLLVAAALQQLVGQVLLRMPTGEEPGSALWTIAHVVLVLAALGLLAALMSVGLVVGAGTLRWLALVLVVVGQGLTLAVLAVDVDVASLPADVIRTLDTWDFVAVLGTVLLILELRRRRVAQPGDELALIALAVPSLDGLVLVAAVAVLVGFVALARSLTTGHGHAAPAWLAVVTATTYAVAGTVSWQRAALAVVVLAWTLHHLRTSRAPVG